MSDTAIKIENLSKQYRLGLVGTGTLNHDIKRWWYLMRGKEDPYLKIGEINDRSVKGNSEYVWALKDINLEVKQGEVLGIIGKNGAGKSTLLKILSKITAPTKGSITYKGRIGSLLEVGTGFHPELTGKENIYLNGAILGMKKKEIDKKFFEIVEFSGCERYIDTPVKRYSSGMMVRLGFAVAAFLEPEILVVDEVLAVGDAEFQKKAIGKMQDINKDDGRTVLFVSHNMAAVRSLCSRGVILSNGQITYENYTAECISKYLGGDFELLNHKCWNRNSEIKNQDFELLEIGIKSKNKSFEDIMKIDEELEFKAVLRRKNKNHKLGVTLHLKDDMGNKIFSTGSGQGGTIQRDEEVFEYRAYFPADFFNWGNFYIDLYIVENDANVIQVVNDILTFTLVNKEVELGKYMGPEPGAIHPKFKWEIQKVY